MDALDIFNNDAFSLIAMTDTVLRIPFVPGRIGQALDWRESSTDRLTVMIEENQGRLRLINPTDRGGNGETFAKEKRKARTLNVPHYQIDDAIMADEVQGVRAMGTDTQVETLLTKVQERQRDHVEMQLDPTVEYQRIGAIKGEILNADGTTLYNLFDEFNRTKPAVAYFDLTNKTDGELRAFCTQTQRRVFSALGGTSMTGIKVWCGDEFWDDLIKNPEVRASFLQQQEASALRDDVLWTQFNFGGFVFENYRGSYVNDDGNEIPFIEPSACHLTPIGVPGLWRTVWSPADYNETVNTMGLPRYAEQRRMHNNKGIELETQMNGLNYCVRPEVLISGSNAASA